MFELKENEALFRVERYEVHRSGGNLAIDVQEIIEGESSHKFCAIPTFLHHRCDQEEYWGVGESKEEALKDCLRKIRDVSTQVICPPP